MKAYALVTTRPTEAPSIAQQLSTLQGVTEVAVIGHGPYDIICILEQPNEEAVYQRVMNGVLGVDGVARVVTCIISEQ